MIDTQPTAATMTGCLKIKALSAIDMGATTNQTPQATNITLPKNNINNFVLLRGISLRSSDSSTCGSIGLFLSMMI